MPRLTSAERAGCEAVLLAPHQVAVRPLAALPKRPGPGDVTVEVDYVTLCGSDLALFRGDYGGPRSYPIRFGHEWSGRVVAAPRRSDWRLGERVTGDCSRWCGSCAACRRDRNLCRTIEKFGLTVDGFSVQRRTVPERYLYRGRRGLPGDLLALTEPFAVAWRGVARALAQPASSHGGQGAPALVVGGGALGLAVALVLLHGPARREVWVAEREAARGVLLRRSFRGLRLLADGDPEEGGPGATYAELQRSARFPLVCECSGDPAGFERALRLATAGGTVVAFGLGGGARAELRLAVTKCLTLLGSIGGTGAFPQAMRFLDLHREVVSPMLTHRFPIEQAETALRCGVGDPARIKVQLTFGSE